MLTTQTIERLLKPYKYMTDFPRVVTPRNRQKRKDIEQAALDLITSDGFVNSESLAERLDGTRNAANKMLLKMAKAGMIRQEKRVIEYRSSGGVKKITTVCIYKGMK